MNQANREIGGLNNRKGNRYEDAFAVSRLIELAPRVVDEGIMVLVKEQAECHVDDLLICEAARRHYYQLKDDQTITWGREERKLQTLYESQKTACDARSETYSLYVVVSESHRKVSLDDNLPASLSGGVTVIHFARVRRPSELSRRPELEVFLRRLTAWREPGASDLEEVVVGFHAAWVECDVDAGGYANLVGIIDWIRARPFRIRRPVPAPLHADWDRFQACLSAVEGLEWHVDRGYFEWFRRPLEAGRSVRCDDPAFHRFIDRVVSAPPATFEEFERHLP